MGRMRLSIWGRLTAQGTSPYGVDRRRGGRAAGTRFRADSAQELIANGISSLPRGRTFEWPLGQTWNLLAADRRRQRLTFTVAANGPFGAVPPLTYVIDLKDYQGHQSLLISLTGVAVKRRLGTHSLPIGQGE